MTQQASIGRRRERAEAMAEALADPEGAQRELLLAILRENEQTAFGRAHGFGTLHSAEEYRRAVPPGGYDAFDGYIDAMLRGERDVLFPGQPVFFARTSGTSGKSKHIGYPATVESEYMAAFDPMFQAMEDEHPGSTERALAISGTFREGVSPGGVQVGSASGFVRNMKAMADVPFYHLGPDEVFELTDFEARDYLLLQLALRIDLVLINALNPSSLLSLFAKAERFAPALIEDLRRGGLDAGPARAKELLPLVAPRLTPSPRMASRLEASLRNANGQFRPTDIWPTLRVLHCWKGGSAAHYLASLKARCPGVAIRPAMSGSSEGLLMTPLHGDDWMGGVPVLRSSVLEFFPEDATAADAQPLSELQQGVGYRVALTNRRGLYRYLMDDVFVVEGRVRRTPVMRFSHRHGMVSSLTGEKLTELHVTDAVEVASSRAELQLSEYQVGPEWGEPPRYLLLVELSAPAPAEKLQLLAAELEAGLRRNNVEYAAKRDSGRLRPAQVLVLEAGEFERYKKQLADKRGGSDAQVKIARLRRDLLNRDALRVQRVVGAGGEGA